MKGAGDLGLRLGFLKLLDLFLEFTLCTVCALLPPECDPIYFASLAAASLAKANSTAVVNVKSLVVNKALWVA